jgi:small subunit ribosomal protein S1
LSFSAAPVVEQEFSAERSALMDNLQEGTVLKGTVKNLTDYGAFVDLGGIDGLLHITDMAWKRVKHPSEVVKVGDEIEVRILKFDRERSRVSLGLKQLGADPWENIARRYPPNTRVFGKVTNIADYGAFVEIEDGVEGLVHVSEMDWTNKNVNPAKVVHSGQEVEVMVLDVDEGASPHLAGLKQCRRIRGRSSPRTTTAATRCPARSSRSPTSASSSACRATSTAWCICRTSPGTCPAKRPVRSYQKGQLVEAMVLSIDPERERISLGVKQLAKDPFSGYIAENPRGTIGQGHVSRKSTSAARVIDLGNGVEGPAACHEARPRPRGRRAHRAEGRAEIGKPGSPASTARRERLRCPSRRRKCTKKPRRCPTTAPNSRLRAPAWVTCSRNRLAATDNNR